MLRSAGKLQPLIPSPNFEYHEREVNQVPASPSFSHSSPFAAEGDRRHSSLEESEHADARQQKSLQQQQRKPVSLKVTTQRLSVPPGKECNG